MPAGRQLMRWPPPRPTIPPLSPTEVLALFLWFLAPAHSQMQFGLSDDVLLDNSEDIASALAGPREPAFLQVLTEASIVQRISRYRLRLRPGRPFRPDALSRSTRGVLPLKYHGPVYPAGKRVSLSPAAPTGPAAAFFYTTSPSAITSGFSAGTDGACTCPRRVPRSHLPLRYYR